RFAANENGIRMDRRRWCRGDAHRFPPLRNGEAARRRSIRIPFSFAANRYQRATVARRSTAFRINATSHRPRSGEHFQSWSWLLLSGCRAAPLQFHNDRPRGQESFITHSGRSRALILQTIWRASVSVFLHHRRRCAALARTRRQRDRSSWSSPWAESTRLKSARSIVDLSIVRAVGRPSG